MDSALSKEDSKHQVRHTHKTKKERETNCEMGAEDAAFSFILESIRDLVINEATFLGKVKGQVEGLQSELTHMRSFLRRAEDEKVDKEKIQEWVAEFREVAYDAEDLIESYAFKIGSRKQQRSGSIRRGINCLSVSPQTHKVGVQIDALLIKISDLKKSLGEYGIPNIMEGRTEVTSTKTNLRESYAHVVEKDFVGLEDDVDLLIDHLLAEQYQVVSICGMGGLGKTTLAQKIYNHQKLREKFQACAWVCISKDDWKKSDILKSILLQMGKIETEKIEKMSDRELVTELYKVLSSGNCFVVLDDIWGTDPWESIKFAFHESTKVLLTTRNKDVAIHVGPHGFHHEPRLLNDDESWELLQKKIFLESLEYVKDLMGSKDDDEALGWKIVRYCGGLPLALIVLGGVLATKRSLEEWEKVHENIENAKGISQYQVEALNEILSLSYENLPYRLKSCFLYMAGYREDESINAERLYNLWIAEGLVSEKDKYGDEILICVAERYLGELAQRSMVQVQSRNLYSVLKFESCRLHDIMRDLSLKKAKEENFLHVIDERTSFSSSSTCQMRRVRMSINRSPNQPWHLPGRMAKSTRSLQLCFKNKNEESRWTETNPNDFPLLRSLVLEGIKSKDYYHAKLVRNLSHLRYLCVIGKFGEIYLTSLSKLEHLQTLDLRGIDEWKTTVTVLHNQKKLKDLHLPQYEVKCGYSLLPTKRLRLDSLRELERLINFNPYYCEVQDLSKLTKLREVEIKLDEKGLNCIVNVINSLNNLKFLDHLYLHIMGSSYEEDRQVACSIQKSLGDTFVRALKRLRVDDINLDEDFVETLEKLPNLRQLEITMSWSTTELICHSNGFPQLKSLHLWGLGGMEKWRVDEGGMPNLSHLQIGLCTKLKMFPEGLIKSLKEIQFEDMLDEFSDYVQSASVQQGANFKVSRKLLR